MKIIRINYDGTMNDIEIEKLTKKNVLKVLNKNSVSKGDGELKELYRWKVNNGNSEITCYGWCDGQAGFENKHDLPPGGISSFLEEDSSIKLLFGDIFLIRCDGVNIKDFQISDYGVFWNLILGGIDDCETDTDIDDINTEEEEDEEYIKDDILTDEEYEILSDYDEDELDIDENKY